jgi:hypothetical protein
MTYQGQPTNHPFRQSTEEIGLDINTAGGGGDCIVATAGGTLLIGDVVCWSPGGRIIKSIESALYFSRFAGVVVGGSATNYDATNDASLIGFSASTVGQLVIVQVRGVCNCMADATTTIRAGDSFSAGRTTAGRIRPDLAYSVGTTVGGLTQSAGTNTVCEVANVTQTVVAGIAGTATAAGLDFAALSGTVANAAFNIYVQRVATNGSTVTTAMGTAGAALNLVVWPTGSATVAALGYVIINPTGTGDFVGGTTALDDATVVPNAKYVDMVRNRLTLGIILNAYTTPAAGSAVKVLLEG